MFAQMRHLQILRGFSIGDFGWPFLQESHYVFLHAVLVGPQLFGPGRHHKQVYRFAQGKPCR
jgi:hypothetical protein